MSLKDCNISQLFLRNDCNKMLRHLFDFSYDKTYKNIKYVILKDILRSLTYKLITHVIFQVKVKSNYFFVRKFYYINTIIKDNTLQRNIISYCPLHE